MHSSVSASRLVLCTPSPDSIPKHTPNEQVHTSVFLSVIAELQPAAEAPASQREDASRMQVTAQDMQEHISAGLVTRVTLRVDMPVLWTPSASLCMQKDKGKTSGSKSAPLPSLSISSISTRGLDVPVLFRHCTTLPGIAPTYVRLCPAGSRGAFSIQACNRA